MKREVRVIGDSSSGRSLPGGQRRRRADARAGSFREMAHVSELWSSIVRHRLLFIGIFVAFVALVATATILTPKTYTATASLFIGGGAGSGSTNEGGERNATLLPILNALVLANIAQSTETYTALLQQEDVAARVADNLGLRISPGALLSRVHVKPIVNTTILEVSVSWRKPQIAAQISNEFARVFVDRNRELVRSQATAVLNFLKAEMPEAERRKSEAAVALAEYQSKHAILDINSQTQHILERAAMVESKTDAVQLDEREARALLASIESQSVLVPRTIDASKVAQLNPALTQLRSELADVDVQLATARKRYTDQHPEVATLIQKRQALLNQIAALPTSVESGVTTGPNPMYEALQQQAAAYRARIDGDEAQLTELARQRETYAPMLAALPARTNEIGALQQRAKLAADVFAALQQKYNDALVAQTTAISNVTLVQAASADATTVSPNLRVNLMAAVVLGLVLATAVVVLVELFERRLHDQRDIERVLGLPVIAEIPEFENHGRRALPWIRSMTLESLLHLCTTLRLGSEGGLVTLAITSPSKGDGKSTIAFHLASVLANFQPKVLLIDADMRRPTLHHRIGYPNNIGLCDILCGTHNFEEAVHQVSSGLDAITSGTFVGSPFSLLRSSQFDDLLAQAATSYSTVIVDCTALVPITDGLIVSGKVDATVLVISANGTDERDARYAVDRLNALGITNVLGVVLNRTQTQWSHYSEYFVPPATSALPKGLL